MEPHTEGRSVDSEPRGAEAAAAALIRLCAWCGAISLGDNWHEANPANLGVDESRLATHSICPACFLRLAPGADYPTYPTGVGKPHAIPGEP